MQTLFQSIIVCCCIWMGMAPAYSQDLYSSTLSANLLRLGFQVNAEHVFTPKWGGMLQAHYRWQGSKFYGWTPTPGFAVHGRYYLGDSPTAHIREGKMISAFGGYESKGKTYDFVRGLERINPHIRLGLMFGKRWMSKQNDRSYVEFHIGLVYNRPMVQLPGWLIPLYPHNGGSVIPWLSQRGTTLVTIYPVFVLNIGRPFHKLK